MNAFTFSNDAVDAIVGFFLAPCIDDVCGYLTLTEIYRLNVGVIVLLKILFVFRFRREIFADK